MKHNKKRNTAFLYESLIKEFTKAVLREDEQKKKIILSILREHFSKNSLLNRELNLYKTLCEVKMVEKDIAEKILAEVKRVYHSLGEQEIFDEQSEVIKKINTDLSKSIFNNFVSNYKTLATISQMFSSKTSIHDRVLLEQKLIELMITDAESQTQMQPIDNLTYNVFVSKFNKKYSSSLNESQKETLYRYVSLSGDSSAEFKLFISEEIQRLKQNVMKIMENQEVESDKSLSAKSREVLDMLEGFASQPLNDEMIKKILKIQSLSTGE